MREVQAVAAADGVQIEDRFVELMETNTDKMTPYAPSMLLTTALKPTTEPDVIYDRPLTIAAQHGIVVPQMQTLRQELAAVR